MLVARILPLGGEGQEIVGAAGEPAGLEAREQLLARRSGIRGRLEHHELSRSQSPGDLLGRDADVLEIRLALGAQRRRYADDAGVTLADAVEVRSGSNPL